MGRMAGIFWNFISENYLEFLVVGVLLYFLLYLVIGNKGGLFGAMFLKVFYQSQSL